MGFRDSQVSKCVIAMLAVGMEEHNAEQEEQEQEEHNAEYGSEEDPAEKGGDEEYVSFAYDLQDPPVDVFFLVFFVLHICLGKMQRIHNISPAHQPTALQYSCPNCVIHPILQQHECQ